MASYLTVPILDFSEPDRQTGTDDGFERVIRELQPTTGTHAAETASPADMVTRRFAVVCYSRAEVRTMRTFFEGRLGRAVPFWLQTWEEDFTLAASHPSGSATLTVLAAGYATLVFPQGPQRRHIGLQGPTGAFSYRRITNAVDNGNGTETLTLDTATDADLTTASLVTFLRYSRFDSDAIEIEWHGGHYAECMMPVRELPNEVPA